MKVTDDAPGDCNHFNAVLKSLFCRDFPAADPQNLCLQAASHLLTPKKGEKTDSPLQQDLWQAMVCIKTWIMPSSSFMRCAVKGLPAQ